MPRHSNHDPRPFLSIIAWPDGWDRERVARLLAETSRLDIQTLRLRLGVSPPMIVGQVAPDPAQRAIDALRTEGGDAFAPTFDDLRRLGGTLKIRDLRIEGGVIKVDLWRGLSTTIRREHVQILVRAHLSYTDSKRRPLHVAGPLMSSLAMPRLARGMVAYGVGGAMGLAVGFASGYLDSAPAGFEHPVTTSDKLDIHTADGSVYQIDGDKFAYQALGALRKHSDKANMDAMLELLAHLAPNEIVDPYFSLWRPPPGHEQLDLPSMRINREDPAFAFYSRWAALMYRSLLG